MFGAAVEPVTVLAEDMMRVVGELDAVLAVTVLGWIDNVHWCWSWRYPRLICRRRGRRRRLAVHPPLYTRATVRKKNISEHHEGVFPPSIG